MPKGEFPPHSHSNIIHIISGTGFTPDWYEIISLDGVAAILDRSCGTLGSTGGTYFVGGALDDPTYTFFNQVTINNLIYFRSGTYVFAADISIAKAGTAEKPILMGRHLLDVIKPGPLISQILKYAYDLQIDKGIKNIKELKKIALKKFNIKK